MALMKLLCTIIVAAAAASSAAAFSQPMRYNGVRRSSSRLGSSDEMVNEFDDFAEFSSTQLQNNEEEDNGDTSSSFQSSLQSRMQQVENGSNKLVRRHNDIMNNIFALE